MKTEDQQSSKHETSMPPLSSFGSQTHALSKSIPCQHFKSEALSIPRQAWPLQIATRQCPVPIMPPSIQAPCARFQRPKPTLAHICLSPSCAASCWRSAWLQGWWATWLPSSRSWATSTFAAPTHALSISWQWVCLPPAFSAHWKLSQ